MQIELPPSTHQSPHSLLKLFIGGMRVDRRRQDGAVPGEPLGEADVARVPVQAGAGGVPQGVEVEEVVEPGAGLPDAEGMPQHSRREALAEAADEDRGGRGHVVSGLALELEELLELQAEGLGEEHLLVAGLLGCALEDAELDAPVGAPFGVEHVADVEGEELVLAEASAEGEAEDHVVAEAGDVLAAGAEQEGDLAFGEGAGWAGDGVGEGAHAPIHPRRARASNRESGHRDLLVWGSR